MERPWGLSGPEFLNIYWIALAAAVLFAIVIRIRMRAGNTTEPTHSQGRTVSTDELAYLAGGARRVVEASVARLISSEALRTSRRGTVQATGATPPANPVDRAVLADAGKHGRRTLNLLIPAVSQGDAVTAVGQRLSDLGLLVDPVIAKSRLRLGIVPLAVLLTVGIVRWINGTAISAPVGWLTLQLVITGLLTFLFTRRRQLQRTSKGERVLESARTGGSTGGRATSPVTSQYSGAAGLVALGGLTAYPDLTVRSALVYVPATVHTSGYSTGSSCSSGSSYSSCGSGSSCGGGGGGCGGGGGS